MKSRIKLYQHQKDAAKKMAKVDKGIICMPTGVGKTYSQAAIIAKDITEHKNQFRMYVVNAPRIILTYQLMNDIYDFITREGIEALYMFVHSGGLTDERDINIIREDAKERGIRYSDINAGTSIAGVQDTMRRARDLNLPVVFFSTYNSADRIEEARIGLTEQKLSIVLNDEAHYLVRADFNHIITTLKSDRCYFFTATMINSTSEEGRGMNVEKLYGEVLYTMLPSTAIDKGFMVCPRLHFVTTADVVNDADYEKSINKVILSTFHQHEEVLRIDHNGKTRPKVLVSVRGVQDIINFVGLNDDSRSDEYLKLRSEGVEIYAVASSDAIHNNINGSTNFTRQEFLRKMRIDGTNKDKKMLVLHYDILAEGISISGFSGIMPLRTLSKSKFLQTFGRSARPDSDDKIQIKRILKSRGKDGILSREDWNKMNKPYAYIMIPNLYVGNHDDSKYIEDLVNELRSFNYDPTEIIVTDDDIRGEGKFSIPDPGIGPRNSTIRHFSMIIEDMEKWRIAIDESKRSKMDLLRKKYNKK